MVAEAAWVVAWEVVVVAETEVAVTAAVEEPEDRRSGTRTPRWKWWGPSADWAVGVRVAVHRAREAKAVAVSLVVVAKVAAGVATGDSAATAAAGWAATAFHRAARVAVATAAVAAPMAVVRAEGAAAKRCCT